MKDGKRPRFDPRDNERIKAARSVDEVFAVLDDMKTNGLSPNVVQISMAVSRVGRMRGGWQSAIEMLGSRVTPVLTLRIERSPAASSLLSIFAPSPVVIHALYTPSA